MCRLPLILFLLFLGVAAFAQNYGDSLTHKRTKINDLGYLPGYAVAIVSADGIHYQQGFGFSDRATQRPYTIHTLQNIGSVSKTMLGIALMQLVEEGKLSWDTPINTILPFPIVHILASRIFLLQYNIWPRIQFPLLIHGNMNVPTFLNSR